MAYNANKPLSTDTISTSQSDLQANFQAIKGLIDVNHATFGAATEGMHPIIHIPVSTVGGSIPAATSATEYAIYSTSAGVFMRPPSQTAGTVTSDINFTAAAATSPGGCTLPCGIKLRWGSGTINSGSSSTSGSYSTSMTTFLNITFSISTTYTSSKDNRDYHLAMTGTNSGWSVTRSGSYNGATVSFYYLAIGV